MNRLKETRLSRNITQNDLSLLSGIKLGTIQKLESGENKITGAKVETVYKLAQALNTTVEDLITDNATDIIQ